MRLSNHMERILLNMRDGAPISRGIHGASAHGGQQATLVALYKRKLVDYVGGKYVLTECGSDEADKIAEARGR